jgi:hypothetical protein
MLQIGRDSGALGVRNRIVILRCAGRCEEAAARSDQVAGKGSALRAASSGPPAAAALIVTVPVPLLSVMARR